MLQSVHSASDHFPSVPSAGNRLCFIQVIAPGFPESRSTCVCLLLQLQGHGVGLREVLLKLQAQVVDPDAGDWRWHAAFSRLCRARRRGTVQNEPHHDDSEGQDVESRELIAKQEESKEKTIEVSCQDAQVDRSGTSDFNHQWHEAVQAKHTEGKCYKQ